jgi:hypothetical protein
LEPGGFKLWVNWIHNSCTAPATEKATMNTRHPHTRSSSGRAAVTGPSTKPPTTALAIACADMADPIAAGSTPNLSLT